MNSRAGLRPGLGPAGAGSQPHGETTRRTRVATHRPAVVRRRFRHDTLVAVDLFSGFGGLTQGIVRAGFDVITAANHNAYKVEVHEANHPTTEHWIADLANPESADYHSARDLPPGDLLAAGVSCVNHSPANTMKAYEHARERWSSAALPLPLPLPRRRPRPASRPVRTPTASPRPPLTPPRRAERC